MSRPVLEGWRVLSLDGQIDILSGYPFKSSLFCDDPRKIGLIRIRDLAKQSVETFYHGDFDDTYVVRQGDILIGMDGDFNIVKWKTKDALLNQRICKVRASDNSDFDTDFLFHSLINDLQKIHSETGATTVKHLSVNDIRAIEKVYPPLPEQQKIAAILSSVDDVIEKSRAQIDKLKDLKTGMMQELLTKGINHTRFKDSPVGRVPDGWQLQTLKALCFRITDGTHQAVETSATGAIPFLYVSCIRNGEIHWEKASLITKAVYDVAARGREPRPEDILYTSVGSYGHAAVVEIDQLFSFQRHIALIQPNQRVIDSHFLAHLLNSTVGRRQADHFAIGNAQLTVTLGDLGKFLVPVPSLKEQKKIARIIQSIAKSIHRCSTKLTALQNIKNALMQDLLTGKVRVNINNNKEAVAA